ncbi:MAG: flagellar basal body-associated FliL family protein [Armatimonadetes bacterium]|nr:flagellar basal body-associated FliL family protein [Armatimonadota bacterium]
MSEAKEAAPKKKGKLPIILVLVLVLGGGGFFMMKGKGAKKAEPKIPKLGPIVDIKEEFLVNLRDGSASYLRTSVSLQFAEGFGAEALTKNMSAVQGLITLRLRSKSLSEIRTVEGTRKLQHEIAEDINGMLDSSEEKHDEGGKDEKGKGEHKNEVPFDKQPKMKLEVPEDWDSEKGPCLKVIFRQFVTQQ